MPQFMLILRDGPTDFSQYSPEEMQAVLQKYDGWGTRLQKEGRMLDGKKLKDGEGKTLAGFQRQAKVTDGPFGEAKEVIGGFYLIEAEDYDQAVAIARDCPQLEYGGTVEVREVDPLEG